MDYKEKYEQALERARELSKTVTGANYEYIFPELKESESEDERIMKQLCDFLRDNMLHQDAQYFISWLEKQGKQQGISALEAWKDMRLEVYQQASGNRHEPNYSDDSTKMFSLNDIDEIIEKISEQKPADKPKFKVGDWIIFNGVTLHIDEVVNGYYRTTSRGDGIHNSYDWNIDNAARLWTIQEAKDGDVLASKGKGGQEVGIVKRFIGKYGGYNKCFETYCYSDLDGTFRIGEYMGGNSIHPTTKKQRDLLFQKMKEAGYEWDANKKELKKIEPKKLDADKVIEWLNDQACLGWIEDIEVEKFVEQFKKDFEL